MAALKVKKETNIAELNNLYQFDWAVNDFLVLDERYPIIEKGIYQRIDGYILGICIKGTISHESNGQTYLGDRNSMLIAKPFQSFKVNSVSNDCLLRFIIFSSRFLVANNINEQLINKFQFSHVDALPLVKISEQEAQSMVQQFEAIWKRFQEVSHPFRKEIMGSLLLVLLHDFEAIYRKHFQLLEAGRTRSQNIARQFSELVKKHFETQHSVDFYAKELHVTSKYLTTAVKEVFGRPASRLIAEALILRAQELLQQPGASVKEVTHLLHFPDQSTFGKFFKRSIGVGPSAYMNKKT